MTRSSRLTSSRLTSSRLTNRGSAVIEMTLIMPVLLVVFYLYISIFLFYVQSGKSMKDMAEVLYCTEEIENYTYEGDFTVRENGNTKSVCIKESEALFELNLELRRNDDSVVEKIRRWQLATDTICERGDS